jgi:hypothetical protein
VKRIGLLALAALVFWLVGTSFGGNSSDGASITLVSKDPVAMRSTVLSRVISWGGQRLSEESEFDGDARSELRFRVQTDRLEDILSGLGQLGATVTEQQISVDPGPADTETSDRRSRLRSCLSDVARGVGVDTVTGCRDDLEAMQADLGDSGASTSTELAVEVTSAPARSVLTVVVGILGLVVIGAALAIVFRLARRSENDIDLSIDGVPPQDDELHARRN